MKKAIRHVPLVYPLPLAVIGVARDDEVVYTSVNNVAVMSIDPPLIGIMLDAQREVLNHLDKGSLLSVNMPSAPLLSKVDLQAPISNKHMQTADLFKTRKTLKTPYIDDCPVVNIVKIIETVQLSNQRFYMCEVVKTLIDKHLSVGNNIPSLNILDPIVYGLDDKYYTIGKVIGKAAHESKAIYDSLKKSDKAPKPYSFHFKHKICKLKAEGVSYKRLSQRYGVYHETIEDWYTLYKLFGREGLTKQMANQLAKTRFSQEEKQRMAQQIIDREATFMEMCKRHMVSLSRLRNWVKKRRDETGQ